MKKKICEQKEILCLILMIIVFSLWLVPKGIIYGHDLKFHLSRIIGLSENIYRGDILSYIHPGVNNLGYATGIFYGNLIIYPAAILYKFFNIITCYKILVLLCNIITAVNMYLCIKNISKSKEAGLIGTFLYMGCAYRTCDLIVRCALGEYFAFAFVPLIIWGFYEVMYGDRNKWWILTLGYFLLIQTHILSALIISALLMAYMVICFDSFISEPKRIKSLIIAAISTILTGAVFIFPFIEGYLANDILIRYYNAYSVIDNIVPFSNLFLGIPHSDGLFYPGIGVLFIFILCYRFKVKIEDKKISNFIDLSIILGIIFLISTTSIFPWKEVAGLLNFIQFPWRLYIIPCLLFSIASGIIVSELLKQKGYSPISKRYKMFLFIMIGLLPYLAYFAIYRYSSIGQIQVLYGNPVDIGIGNGEYLPKELNKYSVKEVSTECQTNSSIDLMCIKNNLEVIIDYKNNTASSTYIDVPLLYYKGYQVKSNISNEKYNFIKAENGVIRVPLSKKEDKITVYYAGTLIQKVSVLISCASIIVVIIKCIKKIKQI